MTLSSLNLRRHIREANSFSLHNDPSVLVRQSVKESPNSSDRLSVCEV